MPVPKCSRTSMYAALWDRTSAVIPQNFPPAISELSADLLEGARGSLAKVPAARAVLAGNVRSLLGGRTSAVIPLIATHLRARNGFADFPPAHSELSANLLEGSRGSLAKVPAARAVLAGNVRSLLWGRHSPCGGTSAVIPLIATHLRARNGFADFPPAISELSADLLSPLPFVGAGACLPSSFGLFFPRLSGA